MTYQTFDLNNLMSPYHSTRTAIHVIDDDNVALFWTERDAANLDNISMITATRISNTSTYSWNSAELLFVGNSGESATDVAVDVDSDDLAHILWIDDVPSGDDDEVRPNNEGEDLDVFTRQFLFLNQPGTSQLRLAINYVSTFCSSDRSRIHQRMRGRIKQLLPRADHRMSRPNATFEFFVQADAIDDDDRDGVANEDDNAPGDV